MRTQILLLTAILIFAIVNLLLTIKELILYYHANYSSGEQVNTDWNATSGPAKILNKPTIPEAHANYSSGAHAGRNRGACDPAGGNDEKRMCSDFDIIIEKGKFVDDMK